MRSVIVISLVTLALAGCHSAPVTQPATQPTFAQIQAQYDAANKRYQSACFHNESDADVSAALHGSHASKAPAASPSPDPACTAAKTELDKYEGQLRAALNAQPTH